VDEHPEQIGMRLLDQSSSHSNSDGNDMIIIPPRTMNVEVNGTAQYNFSVPRGRNYRLQIQDTEKDGFWGGTVLIRDGEHDYQLGGNFKSEAAYIDLLNVGGNITVKETVSELQHNSGVVGAPATPPLPAPPEKLLYAVKVIMMFSDFDERVTWTLSRQDDLTGNLTLIHEDIPRNPNRIPDEYNRQIQEFNDLEPGYCRFEVFDRDGSSKPGLKFGRVFSVDNKSSQLLGRLVHVNGNVVGGGAVTRRFSLGQ